MNNLAKLKLTQMFGKIEHLGIAVKDLTLSNTLFEKLLGTTPYKQEAVESENVITSFFKAGENKIELLQATHPDSAIAKFIEKKGEGIHHIAFDVEDIYAEIERLKAEGFVFINETPKDGADNKLIAFLHPKSTNGMLVELCMEKK
ncbi:methylmalonyl-CoA epimerase [Oscillatoria amoena NRMC-F 0135]|nr:methylmalonyl-CoA epimerase [Oscillatoria amoena NRMC-F 0135]